MGRNAELNKIMKIANAQNAPQPLKKMGEKTVRKASVKYGRHKRTKK